MCLNMLQSLYHNMMRVIADVMIDANVVAFDVDLGFMIKTD